MKLKEELQNGTSWDILRKKYFSRPKILIKKIKVRFNQNDEMRIKTI